MFNSIVLDVGIGLISVYLLLALVCVLSSVLDNIAAALIGGAAAAVLAMNRTMARALTSPPHRCAGSQAVTSPATRRRPTAATCAAWICLRRISSPNRRARSPRCATSRTAARRRGSTRQYAAEDR